MQGNSDGVVGEVFSEGGAVHGSEGGEVFSGLFTSLFLLTIGGFFSTIAGRLKFEGGGGGFGLLLVTIGGCFTTIAGIVCFGGGEGGSGSSFMGCWATRTPLPGDTPSWIFSGTLRS